MSGKGFIEAENRGKCELCRAHSETRPYGPKGEEVCYPCGMKDKEAAKRGFNRLVDGSASA